MENIKGYFDWAATAPIDMDIITNANNIFYENFANPSSVHSLGLKAKETLSVARNKAAKALNVKPDTLFFTSGGTEANHIPLLSLLQRPAPATILISTIEHPAIQQQANMLRNCGWKINTVKPNSLGIISPEDVKKALTDDTVLVCIMAVNNETGAIQPIYEIADLLTEISKTTGKRRAKLHVDCVQTAGKIPFCVNYKGIDSAAFSAHKIGGPRGIGILYLAQRIEPFLRGGGQENGIRSGTENLSGAIAFSDCLERYYMNYDFSSSTFSNENAYKRFLKQKDFTQKFITSLAELKNCKIIPSERLKQENHFSPWIVQASFDKIPGEVMVRALSEKGFYISTGSACSAKKMSRPILETMGISKDQATNAVRFSFGPKTTQEDINNLLLAVTEIAKLFFK